MGDVIDICGKLRMLEVGKMGGVAILAYCFYLAGSLCFAIGTIIVLAKHYIGG